MVSDWRRAAPTSSALLKSGLMAAVLASLAGLYAVSCERVTALRVAVGSLVMGSGIALEEMERYRRVFIN